MDAREGRTLTKHPRSETSANGNVRVHETFADGNVRGRKRSRSETFAVGNVRDRNRSRTETFAVGNIRGRKRSRTETFTYTKRSRTKTFRGSGGFGGYGQRKFPQAVRGVHWRGV